MNIVWLTSEAAPYAKTGGLADVSSALPLALSESGHKISVIMPYYPQVMKDLTLKTTVKKSLLEVPFGWYTEWAQIREHKISENLCFYFIEYNQYFDRPSLYDYSGVEFRDNASRFIFFSRAAMQAVLSLELTPDILHTNDWPTALCNVYLKTPLYLNFENFKNCRSVLTIHNIGYQGIFDKSNFFLTGLGWEYFNHTCLEYNGKLNFLNAGILTADMVNTVSPTYAEEILNPKYSFTLNSSLKHVKYRDKLRGILNGIDVNEWNPKSDPYLPMQFSRDNMEGKIACKEALQREFSLPIKPDVPIFGIVSRLAAQKGIDIFGNAIQGLLKEDDIQVIILGTGDKAVEALLVALNEEYPEKFSVYIGYSNKLAHMIEGGSDFFVMPSRYEPCGLNQMYSMCYGTIPIVRSTGGLEDTVINYAAEDINIATGLKFNDLTDEALYYTLKWAEYIYKNDHENFERLVYNGMSTDFSWERAADKYVQMYQDAFR